MSRFSSNPLSEDYYPHQRSPRAYPTVDPPAPVAATPYAPPPPAYTSNQWAQHQNALADVDRLLAAEKDPAIRQRLVAQKNEMQAAYRAHQPYPNLAARARDQQGLQTSTSVANAAIAGQTAANTIRAQAPIAREAVRGEYNKEIAEGKNQTSVTNNATTNATKERINQVLNDTRRFIGESEADYKIRIEQMRAMSKLGGIMPNESQSKLAEETIKSGGTGRPVPTITPPAQPAGVPTAAPPQPTTQPKGSASAPAPAPNLASARSESVSTAAANAPQLPNVGPTDEERVATAQLALPTITPPPLPQAVAAPYVDPYATTPPTINRPAPVDPNKPLEIKFDAGNYGTSQAAYNEKLAQQNRPEFDDYTLRAWHQYNAQFPGERRSLRDFATNFKPQADKIQQGLNAAYMPAPTPEQSLAKARADSAANVADIKAKMALFPANRPGSSLPTVNPPQPVAAPQTAPAPAPAPVATQPATQPAQGAPIIINKGGKRYEVDAASGLAYEIDATNKRVGPGMKYRR